MPHTKRDSYKAKWLASLAPSTQTGTETLHAAQSQINNVSHTQVNTSQEISRLHTTLIETAAAAKSLGELMDECQHIGTTDFGEIGHAIDNKIQSMSMIVIVRRVRDMIRLAEARIGILSAIADDQYNANRMLASEIKSLEQPTVNLQKVALESLLIGKNPSANELQEFTETELIGNFHRFGLEYEDVDEDNIITQINARSSLIEKKDTALHKRNDSGVEFNNNNKTIVKASEKNRSARITNTRDIEL
jgi:hypothetical protein